MNKSNNTNALKSHIVSSCQPHVVCLKKNKEKKSPHPSTSQKCHHVAMMES